MESHPLAEGRPSKMRLLLALSCVPSPFILLLLIPFKTHLTDITFNTEIPKYHFTFNILKNFFQIFDLV
jgi:hypothetical protein